MKKILFLLLICSSGLFASTDTLGVGGGQIIYSIKSNTFLNDSDAVSIWLKNYSTVHTFSNTVTIYTGVDTTGGSGISSFLDTISTFITLPPGDSISENVSFHYTSGACKIGGNIVVIWPAAANTLILDSATAVVTLSVGVASVIKISNDKSISIYPNPTVNDITIEKQGAMNSNSGIVNRIRIYDVSGKELKTFEKTNKVPFAEYKNGVYFLEVLFDDNSSKTYRVVKNE